MAPRPRALVGTLAGRRPYAPSGCRPGTWPGSGRRPTPPSRPGCGPGPPSSGSAFALNGAEMVGMLAILLAGFLLVRSDAITLGAATAAAFYFTRLFSPLMIMLYLLDEAQSAGAALARLVGVADLPAPPAARRPRVRHGTPRSPRRGPVRLRRRPRGAARHRPRPGARASGSPWSARPVPARPRSAPWSPVSASPRQGEVRIGGVPLAELADLRRHVVLVTQEVHVFAGTVADNLRLARPEADDAELRAALDHRRGGPEPGRRGRSTAPTSSAPPTPSSSR